jgi:hypothetical protein
MKNDKQQQIDLQMDKLLKNHLKNNPPVKCDGFDPDLATAYAEKTLSAMALQKYENHLAACTNCRQMTTEYMLLFASDLPVAQTEPKEEVLVKTPQIPKETPSFWTSFKEWLFAPQLRWVMAAILVLFITGTAWVFYNKNNVGQIAVTPKNTQVETKNSQKNETPNNQTTPQIDNNKLNPELATDNKKEIPKVEENNKKVNTQSSPDNNIVIGEKTETANTNSSSKDAVKLPSVPKDNSINDIVDNKTNTSIINVNPLQTPPPPPTNDVAANPDKKLQNPSNKTPRADLFDRALTEEERKVVAGKRFLFKNSIWTDEEYLRPSAKKLDRVELKFGSEDYQKLITNTPELKAYFALKPVIVIYENKVYVVK